MTIIDTYMLRMAGFEGPVWMGNKSGYELFFGPDGKATRQELKAKEDLVDIWLAKYDRSDMKCYFYIGKKCVFSDLRERIDIELRDGKIWMTVNFGRENLVFDLKDFYKISYYYLDLPGAPKHMDFYFYSTHENWKR